MGSPVSIDSSIAERALDDDAVDRHLLARADPEQVADRDPLERHVDLAVPATTRADVGLEADQAADRAVVLALGPALQPAAEEDEADDDRRRVEVRLRVEPGLVDDVRVHASRRRCSPGGGRADRDERVHRRAVP